MTWLYAQARVEERRRKSRSERSIAHTHANNDESWGQRKGIGTLSNGNAVNLAFNVPHLRYVHGYLESNLGGDSALAGVSGGPTWKGMLWLTFCGLLTNFFGNAMHAHLGRIGGQRSTATKARAARRNGRKGGRPRSKAV